MARKATGSVLERPGKNGTRWAIRYRAGGKRWFETLDVTSREEADDRLAAKRVAIHEGTWRPPATAPVAEVNEAPTFHEFGVKWLRAKELEGLSPKTIADLRWSLELHLLPDLGELPLTAITPQLIDEWKVAKAGARQKLDEARARGEKVRERGLSNNSINHVLSDLGQVLELAVEYEFLAQNPASGKRRRLKSTRPARPWVEPEQLMALLDATNGVGRVLLSLLAGGGLRIGEALALRWQHADLGTGTLHVVDAKTPKGEREVHVSPALREELVLWRADAKHTEPADYVIQTSTGRKHSPSNLRRDVLAPAVEAANVKLAEAGIAPLDAITFHSLRRTYASLRCVCGDDIRYTADQLGHEDPRFTLRAYAQASKRRDRLARPHREAFDRALHWAQLGTNDALTVPDEMPAEAEATKNPA